ncbi:methionyl-tRNA formyltransferase [Mycetocola reblochoni]|uniref:Methionyl-tRNA formyltransferase n=2 Tax=Mycetocola reblochoni TaxID=331618 RepID=A0A1R4J3X3_9MICO|nr:methionyl-tRNA formyltransferase [Mycetocola reblochoni]RLP69521.1 methionyl-tRNA formyltransferase [Mycetocola reblochoni]SJN26821.1 Methionyl-tRNA formyltransferase [Mycetocola reblochoni REB411]
MRIVFAGTPDAAVPSLTALHGTAHEIVAVVTRPDAPVGRKRVLTPSPVAVAAAELGLPVIKATRLDDAVTDEIARLDPDLGVVVAYGALVRRRLLDLPRFGWINLHFSLLPAWRGAAPLQRSLIAGGEGLGVSVFSLVEQLDAGDLYDTRAVENTDGATAAELLPRLAGIGADRVVDVVDGIETGTATAVPQRGEPSHAAKLTAADGLLDPRLGAEAVLARYRGVTAEPGAFVMLGEDRVKIHSLRRADAATTSDDEVSDRARIEPGTIRRVRGRILLGTADDALELVEVQPAGKQRMTAADWWRGLGVEEVEVA